jgi:hypothetical protein
MPSAGPSDHLVAEHDSDLFFGRGAGDRLEAGFLGSLGLGPPEPCLEPAHHEQQSEDEERPQHEHKEQEQPVGHI